VRVELLYFDGCPSADSLLPHLRTLLGDHSVELRRVDSPEQAVEARFLGSPSVRVDGVDVEPGADARTDFGMKCRLYGPAGRLPRDEWIVAALERARA
jgi:hypothetical protein